MCPKPKKSLGQNFLVDQNIQRKIIAACDLKSSDNVLEIGAGKGELTESICSRVNKIIAVEIDYNLFRHLKRKFKDYINVKIINQDILKLNLIKRFVKYKDNPNPTIKVIGNIPYYISTPIIERLLKFKNNISDSFITVQKEFAKRIIALPGSKDYGSLSCFVQYHADPKILFFIKKTSFFPKPKVDSCLLRLDMRSRPNIVIEDEKLFFSIIRAAFNKRRKTLRNSLKDVIAKKKLEFFFDKYKIDPNIRPEDLSLQDFANLTNI